MENRYVIFSRFFSENKMSRKMHTCRITITLWSFFHLILYHIVILSIISIQFIPSNVASSENRRRNFASKDIAWISRSKSQSFEMHLWRSWTVFYEDEIFRRVSFSSRTRELLQVAIVTDTENLHALILGVFIPSHATRSHVHFFISYFFITCSQEYIVGTRK